MASSDFHGRSSHSSQPRQLFPRGPLFTLDDFSNRVFIVKDFVESLSDSVTSAQRRSGPLQAFDPKPLIRSFEHALSRLGELSEDLQARESEAQTAVRKAELQHTQTLETLGKKLDQTINSFQTLDASLGSSNAYDKGSDGGGNIAVRIGERLEELDRQSKRAQDAKFLIQCWIELSERGELQSLEEVRRQSGGERKVRCAVIARQLLQISRRLDPDSWQKDGSGKKITNGANGVRKGRPKYNTREIVEKFSETLEKDLLSQFNEFYRKRNLDSMRECANVLYDFNEGASVIAVFVNQHQFFIDRSQLITEEITVDGEFWERLADPDADPPGVEPSLQSLVDEVKVVVQEESFIVKRAFPFYEIVLGKFLQRVFQQSIQQRVEMVLEKATTVSSLAFLRSLQAARSYVSGLVDDLKAHGLTEHPEQIASQTAMIIDQQLDELFVPYLTGVSYIEREKRSLEELYGSLLFKFTLYHSRKKKLPTGVLASLAKSGSEYLASVKDAYIDRLDSSDLTGGQKTMLLRVAGIKDADSSKNKDEIELSEQDGLLSIPYAKRMLKWLAEAVGRGMELSGGMETPKDVSALLNLLLANMGELYVSTALDAATYMATSQENSKIESDVSYLPVLRTAMSIMHLMITCINTVFLPLATSNLTVRREMEKTTSLALVKMEEKTNALMHKTIDVTLAWTIKLLAGQKKTDFRPRDHDSNTAWLEMMQTPTCLQVFTFMGKVKTTAEQSLDGKNLENFMTEIGIGLRTLILDHFRKFAVNATGGIMVTKDMTKYNELLSSWPVSSALKQSFGILQEIGSLFVIGPEALKERLRGGQGNILSTIDKADLKPYILRREDSGSVGIQSVLNNL